MFGKSTTQRFSDKVKDVPGPGYYDQVVPRKRVQNVIVGKDKRFREEQTLSGTAVFTPSGVSRRTDENFLNLIRLIVVILSFRMCWFTCTHVY